MAALNAISEALQKGKADEVKNLVTQALEEKVDVKKVLEEGLIAAMDIIGGRFKRNEIYIPEVLIAARAMHAGMSILEPMLAESGIKMIGKIEDAGTGGPRGEERGCPGGEICSGL